MHPIWATLGWGDLARICSLGSSLVGLAPVAAACTATEFGRDSGTLRGLPRHRGSTAMALCLTAVFAPESMELHHLQKNTERDLGYMGVVVP